MKKSHILILIRSLPFHNTGGMELMLWDLARQFVRDGKMVTCLTTHIPDYPEKFVVDGVNVVALEKTPAGVYSSAWWQQSREYCERCLLPKVTTVMSVSAGGYGLSAIRHKFSNVRFVLQAHGTSVGEIISKWRTLRLKSIITSGYNFLCLLRDLKNYNKFDYMVAVGANAYKDLVSVPVSYFLPKSKVKLIHNGIDDNIFYPDNLKRRELRDDFNWGSDEIIIVSVSRLHQQKGLANAIAGFARFLQMQPQARFIIIGSGPEQDILMRQVAKLNLFDQIHFIGNIPREKIADYLRAADIFLFTTLHNEVGLSLNVLEALASGLPVILSRHLQLSCSGFPNVQFVSPGNSSDVANKIKFAANLGVSANSLLPEQFTLKQCANKYYKFLS